MRTKLSLIPALQVLRAEGLIYVVLEYGETDLAHLISWHEQAQREAGRTDVDEAFIRCWFQQMLQVLKGMKNAWSC